MKEKETETNLNFIREQARWLVDKTCELCNVTIEDMFANTSHSKEDCAHARWLFWYAYRYITGESCKKIAQSAFFGTRKYSASAVIAALNKIGIKMATEPIWHKRWKLLKQEIKENITNVEIVEDNTIVISVPKGMRSQFNIVVQEKK